jgi:hypothetical protein
MEGLTALVGLTGYTIDDDQATPEERSGNPADPRHGRVGEQAEPYSWESLQTPGAKAPRIVDDGLVAENDDATYWILGAGHTEELPAGDTAPWTHAGPWPSDPIGDGSVSPDNAIRQLQQNTHLRSQKVGPANPGILKPTDNPLNDAWQEIWEVEPGSDDIPEVSAQMKSAMAPGGRGSTDRRQSHAKQNEFGFDSSHRHRRYAAGSIPGNYMYLRPAGRPLVKTIAGPAKPPIGANSQFAGQDVGLAFGTAGAILQTPPNAYGGPPVPYVAPEIDTSLDTGEPPDYADLYGL